MSDPRWRQLAQILVGYSTKTQPGERVLITMMEPETLPLARAVYRRAVEVGALPHVQFASVLLERELLLHGREEQIGWVPEPEVEGMRWADVYIGLRGLRNPHELSQVPADKLAAHRRAMGVVSATRNAETRWVLVRVPTEPFAQKAGMGLEDVLEFFFDATIRDWQAESERFRVISEVFQAASEVRIRGAETDIRFSTRGRSYEVGDGTHNMPDGEIYTAPVEDSVAGSIRFEFPAFFGEQRIEGIHLEFRDGEVVAASASSNEDLLHQVLATDDGARRVGEFGVGTNDGIARFFGDLLYDEKIGGTVHLALGRAYPECGGTNESVLHWDLIKDLRQSGSIALDGREVFADGAWRL